MTAIQYVSQLGGAFPASATDLIPVVQGSTGPRTGTARKMTRTQFFTAPTITQDMLVTGAFNGGSTIKTTRFTYNDNAATAELQIISNLAGGNVVTARNLDPTGWSAYVVRDDTGVERMAIGIGNTGGPLPGVVYWEGSYFTGASHSTPPPTMRILQTGYMFGSYAMRTRVQLTNDGRIQLFNSDATTAGFVFDSVSVSVAINSPLTVAVSPSKLDVFGPGLFGDAQSSRGNAVSGSPAIGINQTDGAFLKMIKPTIGTVQVTMSGNASTRALDFINTDNSNLVMVSMKLNGTGRVDIAKPASATLAASTSYANDAAAAAGGVAIGDFYRNGSVVQVRVT